MRYGNKNIFTRHISEQNEMCFAKKMLYHNSQGKFDRFGFDEVFGRSAVMELLEMKSSGASKLISNLVQADIIEPVSGYGKGKYKFKK